MSNYRSLLAAALLLSIESVWAAPTPAMCQVFPDNPNDGPKAMEMLSGWVSEHFFAIDNGGGKWLERDANDWNTPSCLLDDGRPRLAALIPGFARAFSFEKDWSKSLDRIATLKKEYPKSAFATLAEAQYWISYAWNARGTGYASSVTPDGWKLFGSRLEKAEAILIETKSYSSQLPNWYEQMINVQSSLGRPFEDREKTFFEGAKRSRDYLPLYFAMLNHLSPKWGGSWEAVDALVTWSVENTKSTEGTSMYARMYWSASQGIPEGEKLFGDTKASWKKMKNGFDDLMSRHPKSNWNLNNFAKFSCMADDKKTYLSLRKKIGNDVIPAAWPKNASLDYCDSKFGFDISSAPNAENTPAEKAIKVANAQSSENARNCLALENPQKISACAEKFR